MLNEQDGLLLNNGIQIIINAFNNQGERYQNIINEYERTIQNLRLENESLKKENELLKKEINNLTTKLNSISNTISKENNTISINDIPKLDFKDFKNNNINNISNLNNSNISKIQNSKRITKYKNNTLFTNLSSPKITHSQIKIEDPNQSNNISSISNEKYNVINQKILKLRNGLNLKILNQSFNNSNITNDNDINSFEHDSIKKNIFLNDKRIKSKLKQKSLQFQNTSNFLNECKLLLNVKDFEQLIEIFSENKNSDKNEKKNKIKSILKGNQKLIDMFENIYN
jgi:hypothetical protein